MAIQHFPAPPGPRMIPPLSYAARVGNLLYVSGLPGYDVAGKLAPGDFPAQFREVIRTLHEVLASAGADMRRIVKTNVYLTRGSDVAEMNRLYGEAFGPAPYPARTTCVVAALPNPEMLIEIEGVVDLS